MNPLELGRYRIVRPLGRGGMGVVYEAHDPRIDRPVAIKTIALSGFDARETAVFEARFEAEMRFAGRLQHQNIAALYDTGRDGDTAYIVMELVPGQDLRRLLAAGRRFEPTEAINIVGQLLGALDYAHRRQVIHRDVKPANVMLQDDGLVKLCDFGVARPADDEATRTQGVMVGSLQYASPEQIAGLPLDIRTDLYSTGTLLFELLTGERPFKGASEAEVLNRIANAETPSCRSLAPQVPAYVDAAIRRALSKRPADRFASAEEFAQALGAPLFAAGGTGSSPLQPGLQADGRAAAGTARSAVPRLPLWIGGGMVAGAALLWGLLGRAPAGPAQGSAEPFQVAGSASVPASQASGAAPGVTSSGASASGVIASTARAASGAVRPPEPVDTAPVTVAAAASMPPSSAPRPAPPASTAASAARAPSAPSSSTAPPVSRPSAPARAERQADATPAPPSPQTSGARPTPPPAANRPAQGPWQARITCGPILSSTSAKGSEGFSTVFTIEVDWPRLSWRRDTAVATTSVAGSFDETGRFQAQGQGARKDRVEIWIERAEGSYLPSSRSIVGQTRLLRPKDNSVARECQLTAKVGTPPPAPSAEASGTIAPGGSASRPAASTGATAAAATSPRTAPAAGSDRPNSAVLQGVWKGELACGASAVLDQPTADRGPFVNPVSVTVDGSRLRVTRDGPTISESAEGSIDAVGRFSATGTGRYKQKGGTWKVQVQGEFLRQPTRLLGRVQLLRSDDGSLARECSIRALPGQ